MNASKEKELGYDKRVQGFVGRGVGRDAVGCGGGEHDRSRVGTEVAWVRDVDGLLTNQGLQNLLSLKRPAARPCRYRGCKKIGRWLLRRVLKGGGTQDGYYCDACEERFGEQNLRRFARSVGKKVQTLVDAEGEFRGVQL